MEIVSESIFYLYSNFKHEAEREETIMDVFDRNAKRIQRERAAQVSDMYQYN